MLAGDNFIVGTISDKTEFECAELPKYWLIYLDRHHVILKKEAQTLTDTNSKHTPNHRRIQASSCMLSNTV